MCSTPHCLLSIWSAMALSTLAPRRLDLDLSRSLQESLTADAAEDTVHAKRAFSQSSQTLNPTR
jgi:hypothetical protein